MNTESISSSPDTTDSPLVFAKRVPRSRRRTRYELFEKLGQGGSGTVFRARDRELGRIVAVKVLHSELMPGFLHLLRLKREVVLASRVQSQQVVRVYDFGESAGNPLVAMEYINGESVAVLLGRIGRLPPAQVLTLSIDICRGLRDIHAAGIVHRDLKPANILIDQRGTALVSDFGLACSVSPNDCNGTPPGEVCGTTAYASPEQLAGLPVDERSDLYSLGMLLLTMLTGNTGPDTLDAVRNIMRESQENRLAKAGNLRILAAFESIIARCIQLSRNARPNSAVEVLEFLERVNTPSTSAAPAHPFFQAALRIRNYRRVVVVGVAVAMVSLASVWACRHPLRPQKAVSGVAPSARTLQRTYTDALSMIEPGNAEQDLEQAVKTLQASADQNSHNLPAHNAYLDTLIRLYEKNHEKGWLVRGREALGNARTAGMAESDYLLFAARLDLNAGDDRAVIDALAGRAELLGSSERANLLLGRAYEDLSQNDRALSYYHAALRLSPESWRGHNAAGALLIQQNRLSEAVTEFSQVIQINPSGSVGYSNLGLAYLHLGKVYQARNSFEQALQRDSSAEAYNNLGVTAYYQHEYGTSTAFFEAALRMRPDADIYLAGLADALRHLGRVASARKAYARALNLLDDRSATRSLYPEERARRARCLAWLGDRSEAASVAAAITSEFPSNQSVLYTAALLEAIEGRIKAKARWLDQAVRWGYPAALLEQDPDFRHSETGRGVR